MTERLYLYALVRPDGRWGYVGATVDPARRAQKWARLCPGERFKVLIAGAEDYVLAMERKLIRLCWKRSIPIRNQRAVNVPVAFLRENGRKGGRKGGPISSARGGWRRAWQLHPELMRENARKASRNGGWQRVYALHPEWRGRTARSSARKINHENRHLARGVVNSNCALCRARMESDK